MNINATVASLTNMKSLDDNQRRFDKVVERLSSGLRLNRGADGPSELAISKGMEANMRGTTTAIQNIQDMLMYCESRDGSMTEQLNAVMRLRDLSVRASQEVTLTDKDREKLNNEAQSLIEMVDNIGNNSKVDFTGSGNSPQTNTLVHVGELDVLWVMDQTGSMGAHLTSLANEASTKMFTALNAKGFDLRMAAVGFGAGGAYTYDPDPIDEPRGYMGNPDIPLAGSGVTSLTDPGEGRLFRDNGAAFKADVISISDASGGTEPGMDAVYDSAMLFNLAPSDTATALDFREGARKIIMLITDEQTNDNGMNVWMGAQPQTAARNVPDYFMNEVNDALQAKFGNIQVWSIANMVGNGGGAGTDEDYVVFTALTGGRSVPLDQVYGGTTWVDTTAKLLEREVGDYGLSIQVGPNEGEQMTLAFKSVNASSSGVSSINLSSATTARLSIDNADSAIEYISGEKAATGTYINLLKKIIDQHQNTVINLKESMSTIKDTDFASTLTEYTKTRILIDGNTAIADRIKEYQRAVANLIQEQGIGSNSKLKQA